ncbi:MAG TPA: CAP domain-containing protein [Solirubrobacteraceae bacterium]|nr:CAP domain-containing protein [Solirubrobacteraceae bacterium]
MSRVFLGRATRRVGATAGVLTLLGCALPALGKPSAGVPTDSADVPGSVPLGHAMVAQLSGVSTALAAPLATASRACPDQNASVRSASAAELRSAVICLINRFRSRGGLPWLHQQDQLDSAAQNHDNQMVADRYFGHDGAGGSSPASRISAAGFRWGAYGEAISTGFTTPRRAVWAWLRSVVHCRILLSPQYRYIGVGVDRTPVRGWARSAGTWTADLALPIGWASPSRKWGLADHCPY